MRYSKADHASDSGPSVQVCHRLGARPALNSLIALLAGSSLFVWPNFALSDGAVQIVIQTDILNPDPQPGMKSRQVIQVNFDDGVVIDIFETGVTTIGETELSSVRDKFEVLNVRFVNGSAKFTANGVTASGVGFMPNINYTFELVIDPDGTASVTGCHDGYPAYTVLVEGQEIYEFKHESIDLIELFGTCDVDVP